MQRLLLCTALVAISSIAGSAQAAKFKLKSRGEIGSETRFFLREDNEPLTEDANSALVGRLRVDAKYGDFRMVARGFARYDPTDLNRSAAFPEDLYVEWKENPVRIRVGAQMMNWSATEAFHPADIINSRYLDSNIENSEKRGEFMAAARLKFLAGNVELYYMPFFTEPIFPSANSRLSFGPPGFALNNVVALERGGQFLADWEATYQMGGRVQQTIGDADVSLHVISHIDRSAPQVVFFAPTAPPALVFQPVIQYGGTYQHVIDEWVVKFEGAYRQFYRPPGGLTERGFLPPRPDFGQVAGGVEYNIYHEAGYQSTLIVEGQSIFAVESEDFFDIPERLDLTLPLFQRDILVGFRHARNDIPGQEVLLTAIVDTQKPEQFIINMNYSRRLSETFGLKTGARVIRVPPQENAAGPAVGFAALNDDHQVYLNLTRYF